MRISQKLVITPNIITAWQKILIIIDENNEKPLDSYIEKLDSLFFLNKKNSFVNKKWDYVLKLVEKNKSLHFTDIISILYTKFDLTEKWCKCCELPRENTDANGMCKKCGSRKI